MLTAHVVPGLVTADDLNKAIARRGGHTQLATVGGATLAVKRQGDALAVTDAAGGTARIAGAEMLGSNGAVHAIDTVLSPR